MSNNTVNTRLAPKRAKRTRENPEYVAFTRRILAAYGRRVAAGDVEALPSMALLAADVDSALRAAVTGLREWGYSWPEIADRLGVSRKAAQLRYGKASDRGALDPRLRDGGLDVPLAVLVAVYVDHHPGTPRPSVCPECGYRYPEGVRLCPTLATVWPVLLRRRSEDPAALDRLTADQWADLHNRRLTQANRVPARRGTATSEPSDEASMFLFDLVTGGEAR